MIISVLNRSRPGGPPITPPGTSSFSQPMTFESLTAGTGSRLVSCSVLLPQGTLMPANLGTVRVMKGGVEQAIYIEDHGIVRWPDGSLRAALVQTVQTLTFGTPVGFTLEIGTARNTANDLTRATTNYSTPAGNNFKTAHPAAIINAPKEYLSSVSPMEGFPFRHAGIVDGLEESYDDNFFTDFNIFSVVGGGR